MIDRGFRCFGERLLFRFFTSWHLVATDGGTIKEIKKVIMSITAGLSEGKTCMTVIDCISILKYRIHESDYVDILLKV